MENENLAAAVATPGTPAEELVNEIATDNAVNDFRKTTLAPSSEDTGAKPPAEEKPAEEKKSEEPTTPEPEKVPDTGEKPPETEPGKELTLEDQLLELIKKPGEDDLTPEEAVKRVSGLTTKIGEQGHEIGELRGLSAKVEQLTNIVTQFMTNRTAPASEERAPTIGSLTELADDPEGKLMPLIERAVQKATGATQAETVQVIQQLVSQNHATQRRATEAAMKEEFGAEVYDAYAGMRAELELAAAGDQANNIAPTMPAEKLYQLAAEGWAFRQSAKAGKTTVPGKQPKPTGGVPGAATTGEAPEAKPLTKAEAAARVANEFMSYNEPV